MLIEAGCEIRGDEATRATDKRVVAATEQDWSTEYLDAILSVKVVDGLQAAIDHIERYGTHHTDSIVTSDEKAAAKFMAEVDSAIVLTMRLDPVRRRRRIRLRRRNRHRNRPPACARTGRRRTAHLVQISRARHRTACPRGEARRDEN
jgi:hypothetical protein